MVKHSYYYKPEMVFNEATRLWDVKVPECPAEVPPNQSRKPTIFGECLLPYGSPPAPKPPVLEWKVRRESDSCAVIFLHLMVDGKEWMQRRIGLVSRMKERKAMKLITKGKADLLRAYNLCLRESGPVGGVK